MDKKLKPIANALQNGDCISFLQHGPSGTGKTINCKLICEAIGLPLMETINCSENLDEFVLGKFMPTESGIKFAESFVTKAIRHGGAVVFEEINFAKPQYLAFLNSLLDTNGFVRLDNNEVVKRHGNFRFFATMNLGYYGTKELNQSLYNRFQLIMKVCGIYDAKIKNMLLARAPSCEKWLKKILLVYSGIRQKIRDEELDYVISPRNLESWAKLATQVGFVEAAESTIIQISRGDDEMEMAIRKLITSFKWS
jgi:midasin (ATPase involved in ribosome maturation)